MPNTAQPNQPLSSHPIPLFHRTGLGGGSTLLKDVGVGEYLVIPPPLADPNGAVAREVGAGSIVYFTVGPVAFLEVAPLFNARLVYRNAANQDVVLSAQDGALDAGQDENLRAGGGSFLLQPGDKGVFLQISADIAPGATLSAQNSFWDLRDVVRGTLALSETVQTALVGVRGKARKIASSESGPFFQLFNTDTIEHTLHLFLSDGVNTIPLGAVAPAALLTAAAGDAEMVPIQPTLLEGWTLSASIGEPLADPTRSCSLVLGYTDTNLSPVRTNQGGGF